MTDPPPDPLADVGREIDALAEIAFPDADRTEARAALALLDASHFTWPVHRHILAALKEAGPDDDWRDVHLRLRGVLVGEIDVQDYFAQTISGAQVSNATLPGITTKLRRLADLRQARDLARLAAAAVEDDPETAAAHATGAANAIHRADTPFAGPVDFNLPPLEPCIWRTPAADEPDWQDPALPIGAVGIASGAGKSGKSTLVYGLAAAMNPDAHPTHGDAFGLRVRTGRMLVVTYEDAPQTVARNARWYGAADQWSHLYVAHAEHPLFAPSLADWRRCDATPAFARLKADTRRTRPTLVVIDPLAAAFAGNANNATDARAFLTLLGAFARTHACAVLLIAHDTKQGRYEFAQLGVIGPGQAQGSSQWTDGARAAFFVARLPKTARALYPDGAAIVVCTHANVGPADFGAVIAPDTDHAGRFAGYRRQPVETTTSVESRLAELTDATALRKLDADAREAARTAFEAWAASRHDPDAVTPLADLAHAFADHHGEHVSARLVGPWIRAMGYETKPVTRAGKTRRCAVGLTAD